MTKSERDIALLVEVRQIAKSGKARTLREEAGLSLAEVARGVGVTPTAVWRWERGLARPSGEPAASYGRLLISLARRASDRRETASA